MIRTGVFSGSFNPIHIGHLALANWLCEYGGLEELWFLVTPQNPLKNLSQLMDDDLRLSLVKEAVKDYPHFRVSDFEFHRPQPAYTIDTLHALKSLHPDREFVFILGADNWASLKRWKESDKLMEEFSIIVYPRKGFDVVIPDNYPNIHTVDAPMFEISSTFIRQALEDNKDIRFFLPEAISHYFSPENNFGKSLIHQ